jgi:predicted nuclease of predicted toxin-antitoxin system
MKLLIDMNLSPRWTAFFAESRIEAIHWSVIGKADAPDIENGALVTIDPRKARITMLPL